MISWLSWKGILMQIGLVRVIINPFMIIHYGGVISLA